MRVSARTTPGLGTTGPTAEQRGEILEPGTRSPPDRPCFHLWHPDGGNYTHQHFVCWLCGERAFKLTWLGQEFVRNRVARAARRALRASYDAPHSATG